MSATVARVNRVTLSSLGSGNCLRALGGREIWQWRWSVSQSPAIPKRLPENIRNNVVDVMMITPPEP
jgi:hypothetical protein